MNSTHDPNLRSWVESANDSKTDFPIQNLPFGVFKPRGTNQTPRVGVAIGDQILDITYCCKKGLFRGQAKQAAMACEGRYLNAFMALGQPHWFALRKRLSELLQAGASLQKTVKQALIPMGKAELLLPVEIGDYTDFYASIYHATNVGSMLRPDNPLLPNYKYIPIGYHGRSSSIVVSGSKVQRPSGQTKEDQSTAPVFGPSKSLDYELEVGLFVGPGNVQGKSIVIEDAAKHIFGFCLLNDWSARDIQKWEYQPLGPFLAKNFATSISPWVITAEALEPFRIPAFQRPEGDPLSLPYLDCPDDKRLGGINLNLEVYLCSQQMRAQKMEPIRLSRGNFKDMYWTIAQLLTHHASNGCNLRPGDLLASGTVSGTSKDSRGCLLELSWRGTEPIPLPTGETRRFLVDGDEVILRGYCQNEQFIRIGFGECRGTILPSA